jgi:tRNA pseudouridine38-40 synthase
MARYQVILAYDGTRFHGFQRQRRRDRPAVRTVQGVFEVALRKLGWKGEAIQAGGRTDAGVHASGQVAAFDLTWDHPAQALLAALNANLPADVSVRTLCVSTADFHPRYDALARRYRYRLFCDVSRDPLRERFAWRVWPAVNMDCLQRAALSLSGRHDFAAFGRPLRSGGSTIRTIQHAGWQLSGTELVFDITADAFLYHMVRRLVFTQVAIGQGKLEPEFISKNLESHAQKMIQGLAPPHGLALVEVIYPTIERHQPC